MAKQKPEEMSNEDILNTISDPDALPEFKNFEEEQITFPPYWEVAEGKWFYGIPIMLDDHDPDFVRYVVQALQPIKCAKGNKKGKNASYEEVIVQKDEYFTLSAYAGLPLDRYIGVKCLVKVTGTRDTGRPQPMWEFSLKVSPEDKKALQEDRKRLAAIAIQRYRQNKLLGTSAPTNTSKQLNAGTKDATEVPFD